MIKHSKTYFDKKGEAMGNVIDLTGAGMSWAMLKAAYGITTTLEKWIIAYEAEYYHKLLPGIY